MFKNITWGQTEEFYTKKSINKNISRELLLVYSNLNKTFIIHTEAKKSQLGEVISQDVRHVTFYSRKLNPALTCYTKTQRERSLKV